MQKRYERNIPSITEEEQKLLGQKKILVIGCGGLGGNIVESLARLGIGLIRAVDGDVFDETNLNRQLLSETALIGYSKAEAAGDRIRKINPDVQAEIFPEFLTEENADALVSGCDIAIDALDTIEARKILIRACQKAAIPCVMGAVSGWVSQAAISLPGDGLADLLYPQGAVLKSKTVLPFTPALCASMQTALSTRYLLGHEVKTGTLYYLDLQDMDFQVMELC